jgi:DNA-3-methyladenine glycosylase I
MTKRCLWCGDDPEYVAYHDTEWGIPVRDDRHLFELLCLEGQQAGLSWIVVLRKRAYYRKVFKRFEIGPVSRIKDKTLERLLDDKGVIRNRLKIFSIRSNAHAALAIQEEFGSLESYFWQFVDNHPLDGGGRRASDIPAKTDLSDALSKDLKKRGFKFIGSTICYAFLQAGGFINDHVGECFRYSEQKEANGKR